MKKKATSFSYEPHRFPHEWKLADGYPAKGIEPHNSKVFGTFICGGGSSMGYKLAGYHHLGGVELDPKVADTYELNHHPEHLYRMDIREFNKLEDLPEDLYLLDLLEGSPPCTTFSISGQREKTWGKEKKFREGLAKQTLDDLVFVYCDTILKLKPKCFLLENVKGIITGNARSYCKRIVDKLTDGGYVVQVFCLNAATLGVPQKRERVFFIGHKKEFRLPKLVLAFNEEPITFGVIKDLESEREPLNEREQTTWDAREYGDGDFGDVNQRVKGKPTFFNSQFLYDDQVPRTLNAKNGSMKDFYHFDRPMRISEKEILRMSTFPMDYQSPYVKVGYLCGMSVPPVMTAQVAYQIYKQWISKINKS